MSEKAGPPSAGGLPLTTLAIAQRGMGKSTIARWITRSEPRLIVIDTMHEHREGVVFHEIDQVLRHLERPRFRVIYRPVAIRRSMKWLYYGALAAGDVVVLVEELWRYSTPVSIMPGLEEIVRFGRHRNVRLVATTHRPADIHKLFIGESDLYLGRMFEPNQINYLKGFFAGAERLQTLPDPVIADGVIRVHFVRPLVEDAPDVLEIPLI